MWALLAVLFPLCPVSAQTIGGFPAVTDSFITLPGELDLGVQHVNPANPGIPDVKNDYAVGSPKGSFTVSDEGAAIYSLAVDCPDGGGVTPQISLDYSSQSAAYGLAGYGFSMSGFSSITRGGKNPFSNDGVSGGVTYGAGDNLFLDGKRLILVSGTPMASGAVYCLEGDPYTKITLHDSSANSQLSSWFEVQTNDGMKYEYGHGLSRLTFTGSGGVQRVASWHLNRAEDVYGNYAVYYYTVDNLQVYPSSIVYGENSVKNRGISHKIAFTYENVGGSPIPFTIGNAKGLAGKRLSGIITTTGAKVYRKYYFTYDSSSDGTTLKADRLISIREENGDGESLTPIKLQWDCVPAVGLTSSRISIPTDEGSSFVKTLDRSFFAADLNGDGISDIIRISPVEVISNGSSWYTRVYISRSTKSSSGNVIYSTPLTYTLPLGYGGENIEAVLGSASLLDFDGDGFNDLIFPFYLRTDNNKSVYLNIIFGSDVANGKAETSYHIASHLLATDKTPLLVACDTDKDGKDDIVYIEQKTKDGLYPAIIIKNKQGSENDGRRFNISLPKEPKKLFSGDYNNDGLTDIILLYDGGYKIYFNNGGSKDNVKFTETNTKSGTTISDRWRVQQGDFDGDGLVDFVYNVSHESYLWVARNNGDGTFTCTKSDNIVVGDSKADYDNDSFAISVYDIDGDGRSDVQICKREANDMHTLWLYSDGTTLKVKEHKKRQRKEDAQERTIFVGDFDGDGNMELANYGGSLLNTSYDDFKENRINIYKHSSRTPSSGRITSVTDGLGNKTSVEYAYTTSPSVYARTADTGGSYPFNTYTLPISVVKSITASNGSAGEQTTDYQYKDLRIHIGGGGLKGFDEVSSTDRATGRRNTRKITKWDRTRLVPLETVSTDSIGEYVSSSVTTYAAETVGKTYFVYESGATITDMDGYTAVSTNRYDIEKGVILEQKICNDGDDMYKKVTYSGYVQKAGQWMPTSMTMSQKHSDDNKPMSVETRYVYDDKGNILSTTTNYGTALALTTEKTYDTYGNCLTTVSKGKEVKQITAHKEYDSTGRFVVKTHTIPESAVNTFTYDAWGNVLTSNDETQPDNILTTTNTYDGWGRRIKTVSPDGTETTSETGWGKDDNNKYYTLTRTSYRPWVLTWYDKAGHEMSQKTFGPQNVLISKTNKYNSRGLVESTKSVDGKFRTTETYTYDELDRMIKTSHSSGKETVHSYGNRSVTVTSDGRTTTKINDAWGNIVESIDPQDESVLYTYGSNGKPSKVTAGTSVVIMQYDAAGNRTLLSDSDAGTHKYEYAADGKLLKHTDAKNVSTTYTYDELGRPMKIQTGSYIITNTYGTTGYEKLRLVMQIMAKNSVAYSYDKYGRVKVVKKNVDGQGSFHFQNSYNSRNLLAATLYPGGIFEINTYDDYGFLVKTTANGKKIYELKTYEGRGAGTSAFMDSISATRELDEQGYVKTLALTYGKKDIERMTFEFDHKRDNLTQRKRKGYFGHYYHYDILDRLITVTRDHLLWFDINLPQPQKVQVGFAKDTVMSISYSLDGNITEKTGLGRYGYAGNVRPHAVIGVQNQKGIISSNTLLTKFNQLDRIQTIEDKTKGLIMKFNYGPDLQRWSIKLTSNGRDSITTVYAGNYEKVTINGRTREYYYLGGGAIVIKEGNSVKPYLAFTDYLGSIMSVVDENGTKVFEADYDSWGSQTVRTNTIGLRRGYTGHEMLNEFGIINMNGRLYDPMLGRFFSPDPIVQLPDNMQNYNRYSYCLNNPLKYTDPSGQAFSLGMILGICNFTVNVISAVRNSKNVLQFYSSFMSNMAISLAADGLTSKIGSIFGGRGGIGHELLRSGTHGAASGLISVFRGGDFASAFYSGAAASFIGSLAKSGKKSDEFMLASASLVGGSVAWATGGDFLQGATQGYRIAAKNHLSHLINLYLKKEMTQSMIRLLIKYNPAFKAAVLTIIKADGKLSFGETYFWYTCGDGTPIEVDASKLDLGKIDTTGRKIGDEWVLPTLTLSGNYGVGLVYGHIKVKYEGDNLFSILKDTYDFDIHYDNFFSKEKMIRNFETIGAGLLHGSGTKFEIIFNGKYKNK